MGLKYEQAQRIEQLYRELYLPLCIYANSALQSRPLAEEAVQDTFRIACTKADDLLRSENPQGWLTNTLKNVIRNIRRSQARMQGMLLRLLPQEHAEISSPAGLVELAEVCTALLGRADYELLVKIVLQNYTMLEAAQELGISVEACKKRVQRAKKKLEAHLKESF